MGCTLGRQSLAIELPAKDEIPTKSSTASATVVETTRPTRTTDSKRRLRIPSYPLKDQLGWPACLLEVAGDALKGLTPRSAASFKRVAKIGSGTYGNVLMAKDLETGRKVALKKVVFDETDADSMRFMAREITLLRRLDHPNVIRLEGIVVSRVSAAIYLIFEYMEHDLTGLIAAEDIKFSVSQVKCYMKQLLSGLEHCHSRGVLHRDLKGANLLIDNKGILKIADFGLARFFDLDDAQPMTSRVISLWYRPPELLLGETYYDVGVDLWSAGCILAELFFGRPILPGTSEVNQLYMIWKLCGAPSEEYWKSWNRPPAISVRPRQNYKRCIFETFKDFPASSLPLIDTLLSLEPSERGTTTAALNSSFFTTEPLACEPSSLPQYPPSKEMDVKLKHEKATRPKPAKALGNTEATRKPRPQPRRSRAALAPEVNSEFQIKLESQRSKAHAAMMNKSRKFPPPHQDGAVGTGVQVSRIEPPKQDGEDASFASSTYVSSSQGSFGALDGNAKRSISREDSNFVTSHSSKRTLRPTYDPSLLELNQNNGAARRRARRREVDVFV